LALKHQLAAKEAEIEAMRSSVEQGQSTAAAEALELKEKLAAKEAEVEAIRSSVEQGQNTAAAEELDLKEKLAEKEAEIEAMRSSVEQGQSAAAAEALELKEELAEKEAEVEAMRSSVEQGQSTAAAELAMLKEQLAAKDAHTLAIRSSVEQAQSAAAAEVLQLKELLSTKDADIEALRSAAMCSRQDSSIIPKLEDEIKTLQMQLRQAAENVQAAGRQSEDRQANQGDKEMTKRLQDELKSTRALLEAQKSLPTSPVSVSSSNELKKMSRKLEEKSSEVLRLQAHLDNLQREVNVMREVRSGNDRAFGEYSQTQEEVAVLRKDAYEANEERERVAAELAMLKSSVDKNESATLERVSRHLRQLFLEEFGPLDGDRLLGGGRIDPLLEDVSAAAQKIKLERRHLSTLVESLRAENAKLKVQVESVQESSRDSFWSNLYRCRLPWSPANDRQGVSLSVLRHFDDDL